MKKLLLALLLAVSVTPIASVSADTRGGTITPEGNGGNGGGGIAPEPNPNPNPDQGQGGETTPPTNPNPDQGGSEQKPPVTPQPQPVVSYIFKLVMKENPQVIIKESEVATFDLKGYVGAEGRKVQTIDEVEQGEGDIVPVEVSPIDATKVLQVQKVTLSVGGQDPKAVSQTALVTIVPDTYQVNNDRMFALTVQPALSLTQAEAKALTAQTLVSTVQAKGINADGTNLPVYAVDDANSNLKNVLMGTPGTWNVSFSGQGTATAPNARSAKAEGFVVNCAITVQDNQEQALPNADTSGSIRPDQVLAQTGNANNTPITIATAPGVGVPTATNTNVVALVTTVLVAASLIFVVKRTRK